MTKEKIRYHAFIDSQNKYYTTDTPQNFSVNIEGFLPIEDYKYYVANIDFERYFLSSVSFKSAQK